MANETEFLKLMTAACVAFDKESSDPLLDMYWTILEGFSDVQINYAFTRAITELKFFPKPSELIEYITGGDNTGDIPTLAWATVDKTVRSIGNYASVKFEDPVIHSCIELLGGWEYLGSLPEGDYKWKGVEFKTIYPAMAKKTEHIEYLQGKSEIALKANNQKNLVRCPELVTCDYIKNKNSEKLRFDIRAKLLCCDNL